MLGLCWHCEFAACFVVSPCPIAVLLRPHLPAATLQSVHSSRQQKSTCPNCLLTLLDVTAVDHPFVASLYGTIQTGTHLHFLMEYCEGGELYGLLTTQPTKRLKEAHMRFYVAEVSSPCACNWPAFLWLFICMHLGVHTLSCVLPVKVYTIQHLEQRR